MQVQFFAIFVEPYIPQDQKFQVILEQIDLFYEAMLKFPDMKHIKKWSDLAKLNHNQVGAVLTIEGLDGIGNDLTKLRVLYQLGVLSVGITWNQANLFADGVGESRGAGLSELGKQAVYLNNSRNVLTDVSHLHVKGFWDVIEIANYPIASHSNAFSLCNHPRNLSNEQIKALVEKNGYIGIVFHPLFLTGKETATISDIIAHFDYMCGLGAENHLGFGSDFDGISVYVDNLQHSGQFHNLITELKKHFSEDIVQGFAGGNFKRLVPR